MAKPISIQYCFRFETSSRVDIELRLDQNSLTLVSETAPDPPFWSALAFHQCGACPLHDGVHPHCPIALQLSEIVDTFRDHDSFARVTVEVTDSQRRYVKETSLQDGLGPLIGIVMVTGGCPVMDPLRPLVRFHLPFASMEETEFRIVAMYLVGQYFRAKHGKNPDWHLAGLQEIYDRVKNVNKCFAERLRAANTRDASVNALIILDCFAKAVPFAVRRTLKDYEKYFQLYLR